MLREPTSLCSQPQQMCTCPCTTAHFLTTAPPANFSGSCGKACPAGNICQGGTCMCAATGTCTVTSILPQVIYQAPPFPYRQVTAVVHCTAPHTTPVAPPLYRRCCSWQPCILATPRGQQLCRLLHNMTHLLCTRSCGPCCCCAVVPPQPGQRLHSHHC